MTKTTLQEGNIYFARDIVVRIPLSRYHRTPGKNLIPFPIPEGELRELCEHEADILLQRAARGHRPNVLIESSQRDFRRQHPVPENASTARLLSLRMCAHFISYELLSFDRELFKGLSESRFTLHSYASGSDRSSRTSLTTYTITQGQLSGTSIDLVDTDSLERSSGQFPLEVAQQLHEQLIETFPLALENLRSVYRFLQCTEAWSSKSKFEAATPHTR